MANIGNANGALAAGRRLGQDWQGTLSWTEADGAPPSAVGLKRCFDIVGAALLLIAAGPLMLLLALALGVGGGPIFFAQERLGASGKPFRCFKFRTMVPDAERRLADYLAANPAFQEEWRTTCKLKSDPRVTKLGRFLRRSSMDELPQLLNVLRGDMSLVGPRPIKEAEIARYARRYRDYCRCRPGLTGLWQVYRDDTVDYVRRTELDSLYAGHWSFRRDLIILAKTLPAVLTARGAC
jgi:lipopolysaccharide/colanic/teichoic acid biosynthesis glycosyltransferase